MPLFGFLKSKIAKKEAPVDSDDDDDSDTEIAPAPVAWRSYPPPAGSSPSGSRPRFAWDGWPYLLSTTLSSVINCLPSSPCTLYRTRRSISFASGEAAVAPPRRRRALDLNSDGHRGPQHAASFNDAQPSVRNSHSLSESGLHGFPLVSRPGELLAPDKFCEVAFWQRTR